MLNLRNTNYKTQEELRKIAPSIFTEKPMEGLTKQYKHLTTYTVVEDMEKLGWGVIDAKEVKSRKRKGFQKHLLVFRNPEIMIKKDGDTVYPQILLTNSHDGSSSFRFTIGMFRMVCENGLIIADEKFEDVRIVHKGYKFETLKETIKTLVETLPQTIEIMNKMIETKVNDKQKEEFVERATELRFGEKKIEVDVMDILNPKRVEDKGDSLWNVFNVLQEKMVKGDLFYKNDGKSKFRKARPIKNFIQDMKFNKELYELALEYVN